MKKNKIILLLLTTLLSIQLFGQNYDTTYVIKYVDVMENSSLLVSNRKLIIANSNQTVGFTLLVAFKNDVYLISKMVNIGSCNENDKLIILLENGEKVELVSTKEFNCKGEGFFVLTNFDILKLKASPIAKIRITNGRSFDSYTSEVNLKDKYYFMHLFNSYNSGKYIIIK